MTPDAPRSASVWPVKYVIVVLLCLLGPIGGLAVWLRSEPVYQSEAKLLVHYMIVRSDSDGSENRQNRTKDRDRVINSEIEILTSRDLALKVAEGIGNERLVPNGPAGEQAALMAADAIQAGLEVEIEPGSNVIVVRFRNADPGLTGAVLEKLFGAYFRRHLEVHRPFADPGDGVQLADVARIADMARAELERSEADLGILLANPESNALAVRQMATRREDARQDLRRREGALEKARKEALIGSTRIPNISFIQHPSTPVRVRDKEVTILAIVLAVAGPVLGFVCCLLPKRRRS